MLNSFFGLEMGKRALNAFRMGIEVAGHNVSNVNTPGYSRQRVNLATTDPYTEPGLMRPNIPGQIGTGVKVDEIVRLRDEFLDFQYRSELSALGYWSKIKGLYDTVQLYIGDVNGAGVRAALDGFWSSLQDLQKAPESSAARQAVVDSAKSLGQMVDTLIDGYDQYASIANQEVKSYVDQANSVLNELASLNSRITRIQGSGQNPNDLLDKRDLLLDKLSQMLDICIQDPFRNGDVTGEFFVTLNGKTLLQGDKVRELVAHAFQWEGKTYYDVQVRDNEFDIVENCNVALAVATGPEGVHQLNVDRLANGLEWTAGGEDAYCLDENGMIKTDPNNNPIRMRLRPMDPAEALGMLGSFRIQVGSQGTQVSSKIFSNSNNPDLVPGDILGKGNPGDTYTFRIGAHDYEANVTVTWDGAHWNMTSDVFVPGTGDMSSTGDHLTVDDLTAFLKTVLPTGGNDGFTIKSGGAESTHGDTQFSIASNNNWLMTISDVYGDLAAKMAIAGTNPVITIDVEETDSLETIRNKINEKYQEAYGLTTPEQWVHASLVQDAGQSWYLTIASDVAGEAQRITVMGDEDGNNQILRRLGLVKTVQIGAAGAPIYREVTGYSKVAEDASFTFDGIRYLSADNKFEKARRVPSGTNRTDYSASKEEIVSEGLWLELKGVGRTAITVRHHVRGGEIKALEDIRDGLIPQLKGDLDEMIWSLVNNFNAYQYSGYGIGDDIDTTGVAFFDSPGFRSGAASSLAVDELIASGHLSLIGAAMGKLNSDGNAVYGMSAGTGSGTNAARMAAMKNSKLLNNSSASLGDFYAAYLSEIGSDAARADLMYKAQKNLTDQIDVQRQSVMGVNIDEEMLDILMYNQAFNAMSRYVTTIDEMLDRLINGFGVVGR